MFICLAMLLVAFVVMVLLRLGPMHSGYVLKDGRKVFYVGRSTNPKRRLKQHIRSASPVGTAKQQYIYEMLRKGKQPTMKVEKKTRDLSEILTWERMNIRERGLTNTVGR